MEGRKGEREREEGGRGKQRKGEGKKKRRTGRGKGRRERGEGGEEREVRIFPLFSVAPIFLRTPEVYGVKGYTTKDVVEFKHSLHFADAKQINNN